MSATYDAPSRRTTTALAPGAGAIFRTRLTSPSPIGAMEIAERSSGSRSSIQVFDVPPASMKRSQAYGGTRIGGTKSFAEELDGPIEDSPPIVAALGRTDQVHDRTVSAVDGPTSDGHTGVGQFPDEEIGRADGRRQQRFLSCLNTS